MLFLKKILIQFLSQTATKLSPLKKPKLLENTFLLKFINNFNFINSKQKQKSLCINASLPLAPKNAVINLKKSQKHFCISQKNSNLRTNCTAVIVQIKKIVHDTTQPVLSGIISLSIVSIAELLLTEPSGSRSLTVGQLDGFSLLEH